MDSVALAISIQTAFLLKSFDGVAYLKKVRYSFTDTATDSPIASLMILLHLATEYGITIILITAAYGANR